MRWLHAPVTDRLWLRVDKSAGPDACWPWTGALDAKGYGAIRGGTANGHRVIKTHRVAYESANGPIADGLHVLHRCDNQRASRPQLGRSQPKGPPMNLGHRPPADPYDRWIASGAALDAAMQWRDASHPYWPDEHPTDADLLDAYLGTAQASDVHAEWCRQQILEHLADGRDEARERGAAL